MKRNNLILVFLASAAGLGIAASSCGVRRDQNHKNQTNQPDTPTTEAKPTDDPASAGAPTTNQQADGSITSGGGYVYGYEANPWFIGNTVTVKYCVDMDEGNFGPTRDAAESAIKAALDIWKDTFKKADFKQHHEVPAGTLVLGTQEFVKFDCAADNIDIRFQLGKLSNDQARKLGNPVKFVASTVQTSYDEENMRGGGFIYVAPEHGPLKPDANDVAQNFWTVADGFNLEVALVHELGHVFGLPHYKNSIMEATTCEEAITNESALSIEGLRSFVESGQLGGSYHNLLKGIVGNQFKLTSGELGLSPTTVMSSLGITFEPTPEENWAILSLEDKKIIVYSALKGTHTHFLTRKRAISTFELRGEETKLSTITHIRLPRNQKIMRLPPDEVGNEYYHSGAYETLSLLQRSDLSISGFVIDPVTNKKTFVTAQTRTDYRGFEAQITADAIINDRTEHVGN